MSNRNICSCLPREDCGSITSHAQSTAATHVICAVKSDVVHRIVVCWALWLQSGEAEQIVHIRWPTETFAQARVDVKPMSISFMCIPSRNKAWIAAASSARPKYSAFRQLIMERWCGVLGAEQCWLLVAVFSELNGGSHKVANRNIASCMRRITSMSTVCPRRRQTQVNFFYVHPLPQQRMDNCRVQRLSKTSAFRQLIMER